MGIFGKFREMQQAKEAPRSESAESPDIQRLIERVGGNEKIDELVAMVQNMLLIEPSREDAAHLNRLYSQINQVFASKGLSQLSDSDMPKFAAMYAKQQFGKLDRAA